MKDLSRFIAVVVFTTCFGIFSISSFQNKIFFLPSIVALIGILAVYGPFVIDFIINAWDSYIAAYWTLCLCACAIIFPYIPRRQISIVRKFFHALVICMFGPLIFLKKWDVFITVAGLLVLSAMACIETFRVNFPKLNISKKISHAFKPVLDKKDSAKNLITSHMELLVACLGPVWISTFFSSISFYHQKSVRLSGVITVGVGDSLAAIIGISLKRPHKISTSGKSWEGTVAFIISVLACLHGLDRLRIEAIIATLAAAATECFARDHDNMLIPLVFNAVYYIGS